MEDMIRQYIMKIIQDPMLNVYGYANEVFGENPLPDNKTVVPLAIPELGDIPSIKRSLVIEIILRKTQYRVDMSEDNFLNGTMILVNKNKQEAQ